MTTDHPVRSDLRELAMNLRWVWHRPTRALFVELGREAGVSASNPLEVVRALSGDQLDALAADGPRRDHVAALGADLREHLSAPGTRYDGGHRPPDGPVAYFSAEFALANCLATFSGGLGVLAGDHLRSASDLGLPLVAVGLAYHVGYFRQFIAGDGTQQTQPAHNDFSRLPVHAVVDADGRRVVIEVPMGDGVVGVAAWRADVGRVPVYLLDTDLDGNDDEHRAITGQLYGGGEEMRLRQELVLGVGGVRMLTALGIEPAVLHLNEGHAALAGLERLAAHRASGQPLEQALAAVRDELVFTTHTPVPAGHDTFGWELAHHHLTPLSDALGIAFDDAWSLATEGGGARWNQTTLALRLAARTNGVARLHGEVSRRMFAHLWPGLSAEDVPIGHITNGVHPASWVGPDIGALLDAHVPGWADATDPAAFDGVRRVAPAELWQAHQRARAHLLTVVRDRLDAQARREGRDADGPGLDPDALTIGFARRFAGYKRATLLAHDLDRLAELLGDDARPVQVLVAGKAHPADGEGQALLAELVRRSHDPRLAGRLVVIEGYDLELARALVAGCDVWLNTPLRPLEASGTSGMKAAMNGCLNLSVLDGWWDEAVADLAPLAEVGFGWVIGDADVLEDRAAQDARDAEALYRLLTDQVVPLYHDRDEAGIPITWTQMMRDSIRVLAPRFSSHRMVLDYVARYVGQTAPSV